MENTAITLALIWFPYKEISQEVRAITLYWVVLAMKGSRCKKNLDFSYTGGRGDFDVGFSCKICMHLVVLWIKQIESERN